MKRKCDTKDVLRNWQPRWFGWWSEMGGGWGDCPSVRECVDAEVDSALRAAVAHYLLNAVAEAATSRIAFPCVFGGLGCLQLHGEMGEVVQFHDGTFVWGVDLFHYVLHHDVWVPDNFLRHMRARNFVPPGEVRGHYELEWPHYNADRRDQPATIYAPVKTPEEFAAEIAAARRDAYAAFQAGDYANAAQGYAAIERHLTPVESRKLALARQRSVR